MSDMPTPPDMPSTPGVPGATDAPEERASKQGMSKGAKAGIIVAVVVGALVLIGGGVVAAFFLLSGRGPQPEAAMPADTIGFVKLDLDPSAGQKINLVRFLSANLPADSGVQVDPEATDPIGAAIDKSGVLEGSGVTWAQIDAWTGDRAAMAAIPDGADGVGWAAFVRVDDEQAMTTFLDANAPDLSYAMVREGYAAISDKKSVIDHVTAATSWLADTAAYQGDLAEIGTGQILAGWVDLASAAKAQQALSELGGNVAAVADDAQLDGTVGFGVTVEPDVLQLQVVSNGLSIDGNGQPWTAAGGDLSTLPKATMAAVSVGNLGQYVDSILGLRAVTDQVGDLRAQVEEQAGVPAGDIIDALSSAATLFVLAPSNDGESPVVGMRLASTDKVTTTAITSLLDQSGTLPLVNVGEGKGADGTAYVELSLVDQGDPFSASAGSTLADNPAFAKVMPSSGAITAFVDLTEFWSYLRAQSPDSDTYDNLTAAGLTYDLGPQGSDIAKATLRVSFASK